MGSFRVCLWLGGLGSWVAGSAAGLAFGSWQRGMSRWFEVWGLPLLGGRKQRGRQERRGEGSPGPGQTKTTDFLRAGLQASVVASCPFATVLPEFSGSPLLVFNKPEKVLN